MRISMTRVLPALFLSLLLATASLAETTVFESSKPGGLRVMIDAARGGSDEGASGVNALKEKDVNLSLALFLARELDDAGFDVRLTRSSDRDLSAEERAAAVNRAQPGALISINVNGSGLREARGMAVFVSLPPEEGADPSDWRSGQAKVYEKSLRLADSLEAGLRSLGAGFRGKKAIPSPLLGAATCPAVSLTLGNISWSGEAEFLTKDAGRKAIARAIISSLRDFFTGNQTGLQRKVE